MLEKWLYLNKGRNCRVAQVENDQTFLYKPKLMSAGKETILINHFSKWFLFIYRKV